jgi:O-Antigen ligase
MNRGVIHAGAGTSGPSRVIWSVVGVALVAITGIVLGVQYVMPNPRVIAVAVVLLVAGIAWRLDMLSAIGLLVLTLPFPRANVIGNTNFAFLLLLLIIWLLRVSYGTTARPTRSPLDVPQIALLVAWIVSFYNITTQSYLAPAILKTELLIACILMYFLIANNVRTERDLVRLHGFQIVSLVVICLMGIYEVSHPDARLVPGWIEFGHKYDESIGIKGVRIGGPFFDYELFAEFAALSLLLVVFWLVRARSMVRRVLMGGVMLITAFVLFATVTRGAMVSLAAALLYLTWAMRRRIRVVPFTILVAAVVASFLAMNFYVATYTKSGNTIERLQRTEFRGGIPVERLGTWKDGWDQWMIHPLIGVGPAYRAQIGTHLFFWPHNGYILIGATTGFVGLGCFLWLMFTLWRITRPQVDGLRDSSYARSYMIVAQAQLVLFLVDQLKIDFIRNDIYPFQIWLMFAGWTAGSRIAHSQSLPERATA